MSCHKRPRTTWRMKRMRRSPGPQSCPCPAAASESPSPTAWPGGQGPSGRMQIWVCHNRDRDRDRDQQERNWQFLFLEEGPPGRGPGPVKTRRACEEGLFALSGALFQVQRGVSPHQCKCSQTRVHKQGFTHKGSQTLSQPGCAVVSLAGL